MEAALLLSPALSNEDDFPCHKQSNPKVLGSVGGAGNSFFCEFPSSCCQLGVRKSRKNSPFWGLIIKVKHKMLFMKGNSHWQSNFISPMRSLGVMLSSSHLWPGRLPRFLSYKSPLASRTRTSDTIEGMIIATYLPTRSVSSSLRRGRPATSKWALRAPPTNENYRLH